MKIGIDFDRVLFKTEEFKKVLFSNIEGFEETYNQINGVYNPEKHAEILEIEVDKIHNVLKEASEFLYEDIKILSESEHEFVIVSRGDPVFQKEKIEKSGAPKYVSDYIIVQEKSKDVANIDLIVDDLEEEIERADIPGFHFNREKNNIEDLIDEIGDKK